MLSVQISTRDALYAAYLAFVPDGGIFIPGTGDYRLGTIISLQLRLPDTTTWLSTSAQVIWITPPTASDQIAGIGVQFTGQTAARIKQQIEQCLADQLHSDQPTHTL
ncbi:MAG: PilZ domain-containing protein [Pseudomonadota bacterium]